MATPNILALLALFSSPALLVSGQNETTYVHTLPPGRKVICNRCAPGYHLQAHCTETRQTLCRPCIEGFYTEYYNYIRACLPCNFCSSQQVLKRECSRFHNSVCECKEGFYLQSYYCRKHTQCPAGHGIKENGTAYKDTVCERCSNGYYAAGEPGKKRCVQHTTCKLGHKLLIEGNHVFDNVCFTCENIADEGWVKLIRPVLLELFKTHNSRRLQRLLKKSEHINEKQIDCSNSDPDDYIQNWLKAATVEQLIDLPKRLKAASNLAKKLEQMLGSIQEEVKLCSNSIIDSF